MNVTFWLVPGAHFTPFYPIGRSRGLHCFFIFVNQIRRFAKLCAHHYVTLCFVSHQLIATMQPVGTRN